MALESPLREKVRLPRLSPPEGLWRWFPKHSRFDFSMCRRRWDCASSRTRPGLGGPCVAVNTHTPVHTNVFFKSLAPAELTGLWCLMEKKSCAFSPSFLALRPTQSDDLHFILLYFLWFMLAASNYSFSFGKRYHPVLLHSCFLFRSACGGLSGPFLSSPCHILFSSLL